MWSGKASHSANRKINSSDDIPFREICCITGSHERCCYIASWASGDVNQGKAETVCKMSELITTSCFHYLIARVKEKDRLSRPDLGTAHTYCMTSGSFGVVYSMIFRNASMTFSRASVSLHTILAVVRMDSISNECTKHSNMSMSIVLYI